MIKQENLQILKKRYSSKGLNYINLRKREREREWIQFKINSSIGLIRFINKDIYCF